MIASCLVQFYRFLGLGIHFLAQCGWIEYLNGRSQTQ